MSDINGVWAKSDEKVACWRSPPENIVLEDDDVHVWRVLLSGNASQLQSLLHNLAADERERAERFHFQRDRERFIIAHGALRSVLSCYLNQEACQLRFSYSPYGKPALAHGLGDDALRFNMSHSDQLALIAVTRGREIGVDIERINAAVAHEKIAERFFSPAEVFKLRSLPVDVQAKAFFNCWTRKEAYIKARGEGLSLPLDQFDVSLVPGEAAALLSTKDDTQEAARWSLHELSPGSDYVAAVAIKGHDWNLKCWQWEA
ncbi:MAG: 4'-phosphopantetheinyl transferase superfamily protein [Pyrinomonadaceae bacterium]|nr:4'-phosphopantetheinyl transferase superfamily protein [Pyrinomonadaceae bacterium]